MSQETQQTEEQSSGIDFDSDEPIKACPMQQGDEPCESCQ